MFAPSFSFLRSFRCHTDHPAIRTRRAHTTTAHFFSSVPLQRTRARSCRATRAPRDARSPSRAACMLAGGNATHGRQRDPRLLAHAALPCPGLRAEPPEKADMGQKSTSRRRMTLVFDRRRPGEPPGPCRIEKRDRPEISFRRLFGTSAYAFGRSLHAPCMLTRPRVGGVPLPFGAGVDAHAAGALGAALARGAGAHVSAIPLLLAWAAGPRERRFSVDWGFGRDFHCPNRAVLSSGSIVR